MGVMLSLLKLMSGFWPLERSQVASCVYFEITLVGSDSYKSIRRLSDMGMPAFEPEGAFYIFPSIKRFGMSSDEFATKLLEREKLAVVPGNAFGNSGEGFVRISYAYSIDQLREALDRIEHFISQ